jgi:hypothetical protein
MSKIISHFSSSNHTSFTQPMQISRGELPFWFDEFNFNNRALLGPISRTAEQPNRRALTAHLL